MEPQATMSRCSVRELLNGILHAAALGCICLALSVVCAGTFSQPLRAQVASAANQEYLTPDGRKNAAFEMAHPNRSRLEESDRLIKSFGFKPGDVVADVGSGVGFLLPLISNAVGPSGRVIAEDVQPDFVSQIQEKIKANGWRNVTAVLGTAVDPRLPDNSLDAALLVDVYHHLDYPGEVVQRIRHAIKPGGRLIVADFYNSRPHPRATPQVLKQHIRADRDQVIGEIATEGFRFVRQFDHLPHEYVLVFER